MIPIYIRKFTSNQYERSDTSQHTPSKYFPRSMVDGLKIALGKNGYIRHDDYIIGPLYRLGDFQIGMTGTVEEKETFHNAISRELGEEIGLVPKANNSLNVLKVSRYEKQTKKITFTVYDIYIKHCNPVTEYQDNAILSKNKDCNDKVGCFIYGNKKDILDFLNSKIYRYKSEDDIIGLVAIQADHIFQL